MELLPPSGWGDVTRRSDLDALEQRLEARFDALDARMDARIERALNRSIRWTVGTMIALAGVTTATVGVVARFG